MTYFCMIWVACCVVTRRTEHAVAFSRCGGTTKSVLHGSSCPLRVASVRPLNSNEFINCKDGIYLLFHNSAAVDVFVHLFFFLNSWMLCFAFMHACGHGDSASAFCLGQYFLRLFTFSCIVCVTPRGMIGLAIAAKARWGKWRLEFKLRKHAGIRSRSK